MARRVTVKDVQEEIKALRKEIESKIVNQNNGWDKWKEMVLYKLDQNCKATENLAKGFEEFKETYQKERLKIEERFGKLDKRITAVEVKSGMWGTIGGALFMVIFYIKNLITGR
jgi:hypothetical protein